MFQFSGEILQSKSWLNRAMIIQHFNPQIILAAESASEDVLQLKNAVQSVGSKSEFSLGAGGTSFRFFAFLISRYKGTWKLNADPRLLERPQAEIKTVLHQLGVVSTFTATGLLLESKGWEPKRQITCSAEVSSQFVSGLLLSSWNLEFDLEIIIAKPVVSHGYLGLTIDLLKSAGMKLLLEENQEYVKCTVLKNQLSPLSEMCCELDISSAFALAAAAVINGNAEITNWNPDSKQPDLLFQEIFKMMNISFLVSGKVFTIRRHEHWNALNFNLGSSPDLFPVLAVLCAFASGVSELTGTGQLKFKESDRLGKTRELLDLIGVKTEMLADGIRIFGGSSSVSRDEIIAFDPDQDHRMAMAAALIVLKGYKLSVLQPEVVNKSYPSFWQDVGVQP